MKNIDCYHRHSPIYWKVSMLITSITGHTTLVGSSATLSKSGSSQSALHSQCESKNVSTLAVAASAPRTRDLIRPSLFSFLITRTLWIRDNSSPSSAARWINLLCHTTFLTLTIIKRVSFYSIHIYCFENYICSLLSSDVTHQFIQSGHSKGYINSRLTYTNSNFKIIKRHSI